MDLNFTNLRFVVRLGLAVLAVIVLSVVLLRSEYVLTSGRMLIADDPGAPATESATAQTLSAKEK